MYIMEFLIIFILSCCNGLGRLQSPRSLQASIASRHYASRSGDNGCVTMTLQILLHLSTMLLHLVFIYLNLLLAISHCY